MTNKNDSTKPEKSKIDQAVEQHQQDEAAKPSTTIKEKGTKSKFAFKKKKKIIVHEDIALAQIEMFFDRYSIDIEEMMEDDLEYAESIESAAKVVLNAIMLGKVEIYEDHADDNKIKVKQIIQHKSSKGTIDHIIYSEIEGGDNSAMPDKKKINNYDKMYALLGSMALNQPGQSAGIDEDTIRKLRSSDLKTAHSLANLFLVP